MPESEQTVTQIAAMMGENLNRLSAVEHQMRNIAQHQKGVLHLLRKILLHVEPIADPEPVKVEVVNEPSAPVPTMVTTPNG